MDHLGAFRISNGFGGHVSCLWPLSLDASYSEKSHDILICIGLEDADVLLRELQCFRSFIPSLTLSVCAYV